MSHAPMHYRKQPIYEDGDYSQLSIYVRGLGEMIRKFCNDQGLFALGGRSPAEAVAHKIGAHRGDRRSLAADIDVLIRSGFLRLAPNALVVVQQEEFWAELDVARPSRSARAQSANHTPPTHDAHTKRTVSSHDMDITGAQAKPEVYTTHELSAQNHSLGDVVLDQRIGDKSEEINKKRSSPIGEGVQGPPDASLLQEFDKPAMTSTERQLPGEFIALDRPATLVDLGPPTKAKSIGKTKSKAPVSPPEPRIIQLSPAHQAALGSIRRDPDLARICRNHEQLAVDLVDGAPLVDVALKITQLGVWHRNAKFPYRDGNKFLTRNIFKEQGEQAERQASMPKYVSVAEEPKRPVPPPPPPHPMVQAAIDRRMQDPNEPDLLSLCKRVGNPFADFDESQVAS